MKRRTFPRRVGSDERLTVVQHLDELRHRIIVSLAALIVAFAGLYAVHRPLLRFLAEPLPTDQHLITLGVSEGFFTVLKVVSACAVIVALPVWLYQAYAYVIPAVAEQPRRRMLLTVGGIAGLFLLGAAFGYLLVLPVALKWLQSFNNTLFVSQLRASEYYGFVTTFTLSSGLMFEIPIAMLGLARLGVVQAATYARQWRLAVVIIAVVAALLPGGDPMSMILLMVPQIGLYILGIWLAKRFGQPAPWTRAAWADGASSEATDPPPGA